jgi:WD40 repeat protein
MVTSIEKVVASRPDLKRARLAALSNLVKSKKSGHLEKYYQLLTDFNFLAEKINHPEFGVQALIEDYDLIDDSEVLTHQEYKPESVKTLKLIQGALRISAHILAEDRTQLAEQWWGRMQCFDVPEIQAMLEQAKQSKTAWLRPLTPSFSTPDGRLLCTLTGNSSFVDAVAVTPDGKRLISGSSDTALRAWDLEKREELFTLTGHSSRVNAVAVTPDGEWLISGSSDKTLKVWNLKKGEELFTLTGHSSRVNAVAVTPDGERLISGSQDSILKVWSLKNGEKLFTLTGHSSRVNAVAVTPDGEWLISGSSDKTLKVWNLKKGAELFTLRGHSSRVNAVAVTPDGEWLISGSSDKTLKVWNLKTGEALFTLNGHSFSVNAVAVTPDGKRLISGSLDKTLKVWNLEAEKDLFPLTGHEDSVNTVAITPDGKRLISTGIMHTFPLRSFILPLQRKLIEVEGDEIFKILLKKNFSLSRMLMSYSSSTEASLKFWNLETREEIFPLTLTKHSYPIEAVAVTPDGNRLISVYSDDTLKVWSLETGEELLHIKLKTKRFNQVWRFIYSIYKTIFFLRNGIRDGAYRCVVFLAFASVLNMILIVVDIIFKVIGASPRKKAVAVTPDGKQVISASNSGTLKAWNLETGEELFPLMAHSDSVNAVAVTPDGKQMISSSPDNTLKVWNLETENGVFTFIWNLITGRQLFTLTGHSNSVNAVAVTPDGKQVISASDDNTLKVWDLSSREVIATFTGHNNSVNAVAVTPDSKQVISASDDNTLKVWNLETGEVIASFTGESPINCCAVAPDGVTIVAGEESGRVHFLQLEGMQASP